MELISISAVIISFLGIIINFFSYKHVKSSSFQKEYKEQIIELKTLIDKVNDKFNETITEVEVLKTKLDYDSNLLNKLEDKIDAISEKL